MPVMHVAVCNAPRQAHAEMWKHLLQYSNRNVFLVGILPECSAAEALWQQCSLSGVVDVTHFSCTDAVLPVLVDTLGAVANSSNIDLPTSGTLQNEELSKVSANVALMYAPGYTASSDSSRPLHELQEEFLRGGQLTGELVAREQEEVGPSCVVVRRSFNDRLSHALGGDMSHSTMVVVHHGRMQGASTAVRYVLLHKAISGNVTALELKRLPIDEAQTRAVVAFLQLVSERSKAPLVCLIDHDGTTPGQVDHFVQSTAIRSISQLVLVVTTRAEHKEPGGACRHLDLPHKLNEREIRQFGNVFDNFSSAAQDGSSNQHGGRNTVFLWGCALMANKFDAMHAFIAEHAAALTVNEAAALQAVAVTTAFAHAPLPLFAAALILFDGSDGDWAKCQKQHPHFCALVRFHDGQVSAPVNNVAFCATLFHAATLRLNDQRAGNGGLRDEWDDPDALFATMERLVEVLGRNDDESAFHIMREFFTATAKDGVLGCLDRDQGQRLYDLALRIGHRNKQAHLHAEKGRHLAFHSDGDLALIDVGLQSVQTGVDLARGSSASQTTLSTLLGIQAHVFLKKVEAQVGQGKSAQDAWETVRCALDQTEEGFPRDADNNNTHLAFLLSKMAAEVACSAQQQQAGEPAFDHHKALNLAIHWASRLQLCIDEGRTKDPSTAAAKLRLLWSQLEPLRPKPQRDSLRHAVTQVEENGDKHQVADSELSAAIQLRERPWPKERGAIVALIFRSLRVLLQRRSRIISFYHVQAWIHAAVACNDVGDSLQSMLHTDWYRWMAGEVDGGQLRPSLKGPSAALWQQWRVATKVLCGESFGSSSSSGAQHGEYANLWYLRVRTRSGALLSDIRMERPEKKCQGTLDNDLNVQARVHGKQICVPFLTKEDENDLPSEMRLSPARKPVRFFLVVCNAKLFAEDVVPE